MINLLLPDDRKIVRAAYRHRLFVVGGLLTSGLTLIVLIIFSSFTFILSLRRDEVLGQTTLARQQFASDELDAAQKSINEINASLKTFEAPATNEAVTAVYKRLIDKRVPGIQLTHLQFLAEDGARVEIDGKSPTRDDLLAFLEALRVDSYFQSVESPVKNIIRDRNIDFHLTVMLSPIK